MANEKSVQDLVGEQISAVCFVMDYVEIHFNGMILRCVADPLVWVDGRDFMFPGEGSRDALCSLINNEVSRIELVEGSHCKLGTDRGHLLTVPLDENSKRGHESMHFLPYMDGPLQVW